MKRKGVQVSALVGVFLCGLAALAVAAQDKYDVKVPNGLAFSEFRGYESWQNVATSVTDDRVKIIAGNPAMIAAYYDGFPGNGKAIPDGAVLSKVQWARTPSPDFPDKVSVPGDLKEVEFMVKDSKRFPDTHGWGYAEFTYDAASGTFSPLGTGAKCGNTCHTRAAARDYVFTAYHAR
ncbi:MAG TPA: cytochrome P460 family protein [Bryobacteraceae bacterium]|nr:cytochrome P460 family protein [Bryobacteraceae bacterium]